MANQIESKDGKPRKDGQRPSPDVEGYATDGQSNARGKGASDQQGRPARGTAAPGKGGKDDPTGRSGHGTVDDNPAAGGALNFDDGDVTRPNGKVTRDGGTWQAEGADSAKLGKPAEIMSDRNGPSDPATRRGR